MPAINVITAYQQNSTEYETPPVYQYNHGMVLQFVGASLPTSYRVDFANNTDGVSKSVTGDANGVVIPYEYFIPNGCIHAWIVLSGANYTVTQYHIVIPIAPRAMPTNAQLS